MINQINQPVIPIRLRHHHLNTQAARNMVRALDKNYIPMWQRSCPICGSRWISITDRLFMPVKDRRAGRYLLHCNTVTCPPIYAPNIKTLTEKLADKHRAAGTPPPTRHATLSAANAPISSERKRVG